MVLAYRQVGKLIVEHPAARQRYAHEAVSQTWSVAAHRGRVAG